MTAAPSTLKPRKGVLFDTLPDGRARCHVCPLTCVLPDKGIGVCGTRMNMKGEISTLIYGAVAGGFPDPVEKKPFFHFHPGSRVYSVGSVGCNFRCPGCQNWETSHTKLKGTWPEVDVANPAGAETVPDLVELSPEGLVALAHTNGCQGVAWTYNDPSIWVEYVKDGAEAARKAGLYAVIISNGFFTPESLDYLAPSLSAVKIDVKGFSRQSYLRVAGIAKFGPVLDTAVRVRTHWNKHLEIVTNVTPTVNDDPRELREMARWIKKDLGEDTPWHVTRFTPYLGLSHLSQTPVSALERAREIGMEEGLHYVYVGNVPGHPGGHTYCPGCGEIVVRRYGFSVEAAYLVNGRCGYCGTPIPIVAPSEPERDLLSLSRNR